VRTYDGKDAVRGLIFCEAILTDSHDEYLVRLVTPKTRVDATGDIALELVRSIKPIPRPVPTSQPFFMEEWAY
jgi:hypothetical protein